MNKLKILLLSVLLFVIVVGCGDKSKHEISEDGVTDNLSIASIALSNDGEISEGNIYFAEGDFNTAIDYYTNAVKENKALAFYNIGVCYYLLGDIARAEDNFKEAVNAEPNFDEAIMNLIAVLAQQEKIEEAERYASSIIYTNKSPRVYIDMANISLKQNNVAKAAYYYEKALSAAPNSNFVRSNYANFLISIGEYLDGIDILESILDQNFSIKYNLAYAYYKLKDNSVATSRAVDAYYSQGATEEGYNKLAYLLCDLGDYINEIMVLNSLLRMNPDREYRIRLVTAYINSIQYDNALDELVSLLRIYPNDVTLNMLNYEVLIMAGQIQEAGHFVENAYKRLGGDITLYYYTKHLALFERSMLPVKAQVFSQRNNGWLNLARTVYSLRDGNYKNAINYLNNVPEEVGHDYFSYKAFLAIINKQFAEAELYTTKMEQNHYDTFWYKVVVAWNLHDTQELLSVANKFQNNPYIYTRTPTFNYQLVPHIDDMSYTYVFDNTARSTSAMLMYPIFIAPDDVVQFLIMGRSVLRNSERENAVQKLEGTKRNNEGVDAFYEYDYQLAAEKFSLASDQLNNNPVVLFNLGVAYFNQGDTRAALRAFTDAIALDDTNPFAYLGLGLTYSKIGNRSIAATNIEKARTLMVEHIETTSKPHRDAIRYYYLTMLASERFGMHSEANALITSDDAVVQAVNSLLAYYETNDIKTIALLPKSPVFRVSSIYDLINMYVNKTVVDTNSDDEYVELSKTYVQMDNGQIPNLAVNNRFARDNAYLTDMVYASIFSNRRDIGLQYLQRGSDLDFRFIELYKVSLYYFVWIKDFVNAEASYGSLDRVEYEDQMSLFYKLLYFLVNYNEPRLSLYLQAYIDSYSDDYRSDVIAALINLNIKNITAFYSIMNQATTKNPDLFQKMFIEVNLEKF